MNKLPDSLRLSCPYLPSHIFWNSPGYHMSRYAIEMEKVAKSHGGRRVLRDLNLQVEKGKTVSLFGENGSGKTSLLKIASALAKPSSGRVAVAGFDPVLLPEKVRGKIGFVSHEDCLYEGLSAFDNLRFFCELQSVADPRGRARELIENFEIPSAFSPSGFLSAGMKKRVSIARAVLHNPEVLLLDEPFSGLDRKGTTILSELLERLSRLGTTTLLSTHLVAEGVALSDFTVFLADGRIHSYKSANGASPDPIESRLPRKL